MERERGVMRRETSRNGNRLGLDRVFPYPNPSYGPRPVVRPKKKSIDLKSKTKYKSPKKLAQQQKLPIVKLKKLNSINKIY